VFVHPYKAAASFSPNAAGRATALTLPQSGSMPDLSPRFADAASSPSTLHFGGALRKATRSWGEVTPWIRWPVNLCILALLSPVWGAPANGVINRLPGPAKAFVSDRLAGIEAWERDKLGDAPVDRMERIGQGAAGFLGGLIGGGEKAPETGPGEDGASVGAGETAGGAAEGFAVCKRGPNAGGWYAPVDHYTFAAGFSSGHPGNDLGAEMDTPLCAAKSGKVFMIGDHPEKDGWINPNDPDEGHFLMIVHDDKDENGNYQVTYYGHMSEPPFMMKDGKKIPLKPGDRVNGGQVIGSMGNTGDVVNHYVHVHFEKRVGPDLEGLGMGGSVDPSDILSDEGRASAES
jgi:murein DD-endopeptidase MepM/ murein hydrolase activator NlpD